MSEIAVHCTQLQKAFTGQPVICDLTLTVPAGTILALLGPSGCGKTTLLRLLAGFETLDAGRIEIDGQTVANGRFHLPPEKRRVGMVFQDYAIFPHLSAAQNIAFGLGRGSQANARTQALLDMVGLPETGSQMPHELSGGQQQRVALARALAPEPVILLLDEPFSNLDASLRVQVRAEVRDLLKRSATTAIFVTHDQEEALFIGDLVAVMRQGVLEQVGTPAEIYHQPRTRFVADFMGQTDFLPGLVTDQGIETPLGVLDQPCPGGPGTRLDVVVRPDDVQLAAAEAGNGYIADRRFTGMAYIYSVVLNDGRRIHSWQPHTLDLALGQPVLATLDPGHPLTCFRNGQGPA
jgi:iron(III) transport system ATP-binding protein